MSLCYDFQKWTMISLASIAISLTVGLVLMQVVYGQTKDWHDPSYMRDLDKLRDYCFEHADRSAKGENVGNDLVKSGLVDSSFYDWSCVKIQEELKNQGEMEAWDYIGKCGLECLMK
jgi:hypothetical protein